MDFVLQTFHRFAPQVNEFYHADFRRLLETHISLNESVIWASNYSFAYEGSIGYGGYVILTLSRFIQVAFQMEKTERPEIYAGIEVSRAMSLPTSPLKDFELQSRSVRELLPQQFLAIHQTICRTSQGESLVRLDLFTRPEMDYPWTRLFLYNAVDATELCEIIRRYSSELEYFEQNIKDR